ncbi:helix-turn-helix domain-containing protein [Streptomyces sp. NPDC050485]|uniref:helix-turn-helix domain-containing protein n=1 Tax=Streptomyces sp. NPDC050485 TaxID=3365617 RepID=UPI0037AB994D
MDYSACPAANSTPMQHPPRPDLGPGVLRYRGFRLDGGARCGHLELPAGAVSVVLLLEGEVRLGSPPGGPLSAKAYTAPVCGLRTSALFSEHDSRLTGIEITLAPWAAYRLFRIPMHELSNRVWELSDLPGDLGGGLSAALVAESDWRRRFALLDTELAALWSAGPSHAPPVASAWRRLAQHPGALSMAQLAHEVGWSQSQLERRFLEQIGVTPKTAARIMRLRRSLRLLTDGHSTAEVALLAGYYDQAHFSREFKKMTGFPARLLRRHRENSEFIQDRRCGRPAQYSLPELVR